MLKFGIFVSNLWEENKIVTIFFSVFFFFFFFFTKTFLQLPLSFLFFSFLFFSSSFSFISSFYFFFFRILSFLFFFLSLDPKSWRSHQSLNFQKSITKSIFYFYISMLTMMITSFKRLNILLSFDDFL